MIEFKPKRPSSLTPEIWRSKLGDAAADKGYAWYCDTYYEYLGGGYYSQHEAEMMAERAGLYMALINAQQMLEGLEA